MQISQMRPPVLIKQANICSGLDNLYEFSNQTARGNSRKLEWNGIYLKCRNLMENGRSKKFFCLGTQPSQFIEVLNSGILHPYQHVKHKINLTIQPGINISVSEVPSSC